MAPNAPLLYFSNALGHAHHQATRQPVAQVGQTTELTVQCFDQPDPALTWLLS